MAVTTIIENHQPSHKLRHYTITLNDTHTISTTVTSHPGAARDWIHRTLFFNRRHRHHLLVGLGVQWTPHNNPASTIQLCIGHHCLIFHLHHSQSSPLILRRILLDPSITFVGLWCHSDAKKLLLSPHKLGMVDGMPIDMRIHAFNGHGRSLRGSSIIEIVDEVLGVVIDWDLDVGRSDWEVDELSLEHVRQASVDAFVSFAVGLHYQAWNFNKYC
ncbi:Exonuclease 3'-5' domain-containing protein 2 [Bienertia sinuspersici]